MKTIEIDECIRRIRSYAMQFEAEGKRNISEDLWVAVDFLKRQTAMCFDCTQREWYMRGYQDGLNADKWIPCEERLPECEWGCETEPLMFQIKNSDYIEIGYYGEGGEYRDRYFRTYIDTLEGYDASDIIAWQPLPTQPYKKEGAENE